MVFQISRGAAALAALAGMACLPANLYAHDSAAPPGTAMTVSSDHHGSVRADGHAPIGVMGDHMHKAGEFMLSYRTMHMDMQGNRIGTDSVSPEEIVTRVPGLRVVPTRMPMQMHMFGAMYAPTDWLTLMGMVNYIDKSMDHITFDTGTGTGRVGTFTTESKGFGDTSLTALIRVLEQTRPDGKDHVHINFGLSLPTGSITERDDILTPKDTRPNVRLPYSMQLGSGTFDLLPGITYNGRDGDLSWGAQYRATLRLEDENDEGYRRGHVHKATAWLAYQWAPWISTSLRVAGSSEGRIKGIDSQIAAPVQTADPDNYGGERVDLFAGVNLVGQTGDLRGHRLAFEVGAPVYQDLNGPQMETDWTLTVGWQKAW